ncbi:MAG: hypothetical protein ABSC55_21715 [Syntrophorhabdales bacterium]
MSLSEGDHLPEVDDDTCITCFCCQEICPSKAITLSPKLPGLRRRIPLIRKGFRENETWF